MQAFEAEFKKNSFKINAKLVYFIALVGMKN